jgi:hypothetical protein
MLRFADVSIVALATGVVLYALLNTTWHISFLSGIPWISLIIGFIASMSAIVPGFVAGMVAGQRGLLHGLLLSLGIFAYAIIKIFIVRDGVSFGRAFGMTTFLLSAGAIAGNIVACIAGAAVKRHGVLH